MLPGMQSNREAAQFGGMWWGNEACRHPCRREVLARTLAQSANETYLSSAAWGHCGRHPHSPECRMVLLLCIGRNCNTG